MRRPTTEDLVVLADIRPGDEVRFRWRQSLIIGPAIWGPHGSLCVAVAGQPVAFAQRNAANNLAPLREVRMVGHQPSLF